MTAEDREEQLSDDYMAQISERLRIGIALIYVPILNLVWKVGHRSQPKGSKRRDAELLDILSRRWDVHMLIPFRRQAP